MKNILITILAFSISSCAYIVNKGVEEVKFSSNQENVLIMIDNQPKQKLPISVKLSRCEDHNIIFEKENYQEKYLHIIRKESLQMTILSSFMIGPIGLTIDQYLCSLSTFNQPDVFVELER